MKIISKKPPMTEGGPLLISPSLAKDII